MDSNEAGSTPRPAVPPRLRVALVCSGLGRTARGYERFFHDLALQLQNSAEVRVYAGRCPPGLRGASVPCLPRGMSSRIGLDQERAYYWEQVTFGVGLLPWLQWFQPDVIHLSDPALTNLLLRLRRFVPGRPVLLFCNGGPISPAHYCRYDHVQLLTPHQLKEAVAAGIDPSRITLLPYGIDAAQYSRALSQLEARAQARLPAGRLAISVAALNASHKRLDYLIREFGAPGASDWTLLCLGQPTAETPALRRLADEVAPGRVIFRTASSAEVPVYLAAADLFVLTSHSEGFGLAAVEAMAAGLPVVLRDTPALRYLVEDDEQLDPLLEPGALLRFLEQARSESVCRSRGARNRERALAVFDWRSVLPAYLQLYSKVVTASAG